MEHLACGCLESGNIGACAGSALASHETLGEVGSELVEKTESSQAPWRGSWPEHGLECVYRNREGRDRVVTHGVPALRTYGELPVAELMEN